MYFLDAEGKKRGLDGGGGGHEYTEGRRRSTPSSPCFREGGSQDDGFGVGCPLLPPFPPPLKGVSDSSYYATLVLLGGEASSLFFPRQHRRTSERGRTLTSNPRGKKSTPSSFFLPAPFPYCMLPAPHKKLLLWLLPLW